MGAVQDSVRGDDQILFQTAGTVENRKIIGRKGFGAFLLGRPLVGKDMGCIG